VKRTAADRAGIFAYWPNRITAARFVGSLVLFGLLIAMPRLPLEGPTAASIASFWLFLAVAVTDWLDGYLARRDGVVTAFGRIADPFVDKVMVLGAMVLLGELPGAAEYFPGWVIVVVLAREFLVTGIRGYMEAEGFEFAADKWGKLKMVFQCIALGVVLGRGAFPFQGVPYALETLHWLAWIAVALTVISSTGSGLGYVLKTRAMIAARQA
jgi:CDP-diacylglycerol--glycerol-3-phosphate 3-phosphatidyltransferase